MSVLIPTALHSVNGLIVSPDEIVNIALGEDQIPVSFTMNLIGKF